MLIYFPRSNLILLVDQSISSFNNYYVLLISVLFLDYRSVPMAAVFTTTLILFLSLVRNTVGGLVIHRQEPFLFLWKRKFLGFIIFFILLTWYLSTYFFPSKTLNQVLMITLGLISNMALEIFRLNILSKGLFNKCLILDSLQALLLIASLLIFDLQYAVSPIQIEFVWSAVTFVVMSLFFITHTESETTKRVTDSSKPNYWFQFGILNSLLSFLGPVIITIIYSYSGKSENRGFYLSVVFFFLPIGFFSNYLFNLSLTGESIFDLSKIFSNTKYFLIILEAISVISICVWRINEIDHFDFDLTVFLCVVSSVFSFLYFKMGLLLYLRGKFKVRFQLTVFWFLNSIFWSFVAVQFEVRFALALGIMIAEAITWLSYKVVVKRK